jgi:hypothetical protein
MSDARIHDSRGRLLVRIGKVTVVRRPLQSMVCSGRLTICDQKCLAALHIVYGQVNSVHVLSLRSFRSHATNLEGAGAIYQQFSPGDAIDVIALVKLYI